MTPGETVAAAVERRRELVNAAIGEQLPVEEPTHLYGATRHLFDAGGKRLRPAVTLLVAEALTGTAPDAAGYRAMPTPGEPATGEAATDETGASATGARATEASAATVDVLSAAVSIEVIQSFTLIHDDIMDDDDLRRGAPAVHKEYDLETAILAGDTLYAKAFEFMLETDAPPERMVTALSTLACTCTAICEGQSLDIAFESRETVAVEEYLGMVEQKTAVLYAAAASIPAILLDAEETTIDALRQYGLDVGRAFQIRDDLLDLTVPSDRLGKRRGSDLVENKRTVVTLHASEQGIDVDDLVADDPAAVSESDIDAAVERLEDAGSIDYARELSRDLMERGQKRLEHLPEGDARELLSGVAAYLVERGY